MEQTYWLDRKRASAANARGAKSAEARLAHLDLAGRYSIKAAASAPPEPPQPALQVALAHSEPADADYYGRLEAGAVWLSTQTDVEGERRDHLGKAAHYARLRLEAEPSKGG